MTLDSLLAQNNISMYKLAKKTGLAQSTISDLISGKTKIENCRLETAYAVSKAICVTLEQFYLCGKDPVDLFDHYKTPSEDEMPLFLKISIGNWYKSTILNDMGLKDDEWDCVLDELASSINAVENSGLVDEKFAWWLRNRYLFNHD